jgi:hypothetical protein
MACNVPYDPEVEKAFWNEAKKGLAAGLEPEDVIKQIAQTHKIGTDAVGAVLQSKQLFQLTNEAWAKQAKLGELRATAKRAALGADDKSWLKALKYPYEGTRQSLTVGHGGAIPFTHARDAAFVPGEQKIFAETVRQAYSYAVPEKISPRVGKYKVEIPLGGKGDARWRADMATLRTDPGFKFWSRVGLDIKLQSKPVGMGMSRWTRRSFDALKTMRLKLAKKYWNQLDPADRTFENAQDLAKRINHATGTVSTPPIVSKIAGATMFAPKLRFAKYSTAADAVTSKFGAKRFAKIAAVNLGILAINDMFNRHVLQNDDKVNWKDPTRADWMRLKIAGMTFPMSPLFETMRLPINAGATLLDPRQDDKARVLTKEIASALHPGLNAAYGLTTGKDLATGNSLPFRGASQYLYGEHRGEKPMFGKMVKDKYAKQMTGGEYAGGFAPIPAQSIVKAMAKGEGIPPSTAAPYVEAIMSGLFGTHAYPNVPYKAKQPLKP